MTRESLRALGKWVVIGLAVSVVIVLADTVVGLRFNPILTPIAGAVVGVLIWAGTHLVHHEPAAWQQPSFHHRSVLLRADVRTRRLAHSLAHSQPGKGFDSSSVAAHLGDIVSRKLVAAGTLPPDATLAQIEPHVSPSLFAYLRSVDDDRRTTLTRRALHAHLKEIDSL